MHHFKRFLFFSFSLMLAQLAMAQENTLPENYKEQVLHHDSVFWQAYNACDVETMALYFSDDFEFYHDKGGLTKGGKNFKQEIQEGLCGKENWHMRRELLPESLELYPIKDYGMVLSGEHIFFIRENGNEYLDGQAKFTHVWRYGDGQWQMTRALSIGHRPAEQGLAHKTVELSDRLLKSYAGTYQAPNTGTVVIRQEGKGLAMEAGKMQAVLMPESETVFFHAEMPLTFEFVKKADGQIEKMVVREGGKIVEEAKRTQ